MACIVCNMIQMACEFENASSGYIEALKIFNYVFSAIFILEATLKLIAFGASYFENAWNKFDFFVVTASILDIALGAIGSSTLAQISFMP